MKVSDFKSQECYPVILFSPYAVIQHTDIQIYGKEMGWAEKFVKPERCTGTECEEGDRDGNV